MRHTATLVLFMAFLMALPQAALPRSEEVIVVEVTSMIASSAEPAPGGEDDVDVDPRLAGLRKKLRSLFAYTSYDFLDRTRSEARVGEVCETRLPGRFLLEVEPEPTEGERPLIEMTVSLVRNLPADRSQPGEVRPRREMVLRTKIRLENGGTVLLGGPPVGEGVLILALSARR